MSAESKDIGDPKKGFNALIERVKADPKIPLMIAGAAAIAMIVVLFLWLKSPEYRVLYSNVSAKDGGEITGQLTQMNVPYQLADNGSAVLVPADQVHELRLKLAQQGLPKGGAVGFELLDKEQFGASQFSEQVNYQRALEGELARTIETLSPVQSARVHLAIPKPTLFVREQKSPTASVTVGLLQGRALDDEQINAIVHMVSSSVSGLPASNVTIVDLTGRLLTNNDNSQQSISNAQLKLAHDIEERLKTRIETILGPIVGRANVQAQVTAQVDFSRTEQTSEQYKPNQSPDSAAIRSRQSNNSQQSANGGPGGVPGELSNQPATTPSAPITADDKGNEKGKGKTDTKNTTTKATILNLQNGETTNYEVDKTISHVQRQVGTIERLSVAVIVNYSPVEGENGPEMKPLSPEMMQQIEALTREAVGYSPARGDTLNIVNSHFTETVNSEASEPSIWTSPIVIEKAIEFAKFLLILFVAWLLWRRVVKPQLLKYRQAQQVEKEAELFRTAQSKKPLVVEPEDAEEMDEKTRRRLTRQRVSAEIQSQRIREMAEKDPQVVAMVMRQWLGKAQ